MKSFVLLVSLKREWTCKVEIILLLLILIVIGFFIFTQKNSKVKNSAIKKEEIITQYENDLQSLLRKHQNNKEMQLKQKKIFLQNCNSELSRNIFFTHEETVKVIERLLKS